jgi:hypothetical protein
MLFPQVNKMRYKDGKGDPRGFINFLREAKLPASLLPRYRGNRLHVLFEYCRIFLIHRTLLQAYFDGAYGGASVGKLRNSISIDFSSPQGLLEFVSLNIIGQLLSAPWMAAFYRSAEKQHTYAEAVGIVKRVLAELKSVKEPIQLLSRTTDFFSHPLSEATIDQVRQHSTLCDSSQLEKALAQLLEAAIAVIERQYGSLECADHP